MATTAIANSIATHCNATGRFASGFVPAFRIRFVSALVLND
jgi:hypothetical protein